MNVFAAIWPTLLFGMGLVFAGCPKRTVEDASSKKTTADEPTSENSTDSADSEVLEVSPFPIVTRIPQTPVNELTERQQKQIAARVNFEYCLRSEMVDVSFFSIDAEELSIEAFGKTYTLVKTGEDRIDSEFQIWEGFVKECDSEISVKFNEDDRWMGLGFRCNGLKYILDSLSDGLYLMQEMDLRNWHPKDDQTRIPPQGGGAAEVESQEQYAVQMSTIGSPTPVLRVMIVFTQETAIVIDDTRKIANAAIKSMNKSFTNSKIDYRVELAGIYETDYDETSDPGDDLNAFVSPNDGRMDEIHRTRADVGADVAVLVRNMDPVINPNDRLCGRANDIDASVDTAFATVWWKCMDPDMGKYSFTHEIGHLLGCRHQQSKDSNDTPFEYGHGYAINDKWSTIMATIDGPADCPDDCPRVNYWSNPNVWYSGGYMGVDDMNDNARVIKNRAARMAGLYETPLNFQVPAEGVPNHHYRDYVAINSIESDDDFVVESGAGTNFRAKSVKFKTGF